MNQKKLILKVTGAFFLLVAAAGTAYGQELIETSRTAMVSNIDLPSFFICVIGGVLLAIAFQTVLTLISIAAGVTAIGDLEEKGHNSGSSRNTKKDKDSTAVGVKISNAMGVWTLVTVSVSLFFASWLAVRLSLIDINFVGVSLGLIIWATFFTLMVYLEVKMVTSLLGGLINTALSTLRSGFSAVGSAFSKSPQSEMKEVAAYTIDHARQELATVLDTSKVDKKIDKWVKTLQPDYTSLRKELSSLIQDIEIKEEETLGREGVTREMFLNVTGTVPSLSKQDKKKMGEIFDEIKSAAQTEGSRSDKMLAAVDKLTPGAEEDVREFRMKVEQYLREANRDELNPDSLKRDLEQILQHPSRSPEIIRNRLNQLDRNSLVAVLEQRPGINHQDAERYAGYAEQAINTIRSRFSDTQNKLGELSGKVQPGGGPREKTDLSNAEMGVIHTDRGDRVASYAPAEESFKNPVSQKEGAESEKQSKQGAQEKTDLRNAEMGAIHTERGEKVAAYAPAQENFKGGGQKKDTSAIEARIRGFFEEMPGQEWDYERIKRDFIQMYQDPSAAPTILKQRLDQYDRDSFIVLMENTGILSREKAEKVADTAMDAKNEVIQKSNELEEQARTKVQQAKEFALEQAEATRKSAVAASWWLVGTAVVSALAAALGGMAAL